MALKVQFIPTKRSLEDTIGIDRFALSETENIKVIGKEAFPSAVLAKHNEVEVILKEMLDKLWDEERNKFIKEIKILTISYQYLNVLDPTGASYARNWLGVIMITIPKPSEDFTFLDVICHYTLNKVNITMTSGTYKTLDQR